MDFITDEKNWRIPFILCHELYKFIRGSRGMCGVHDGIRVFPKCQEHALEFFLPLRVRPIRDKTVVKGDTHIFHICLPLARESILRCRDDRKKRLFLFHFFIDTADGRPRLPCPCRHFHKEPALILFPFLHGFSLVLEESDRVFFTRFLVSLHTVKIEWIFRLDLDDLFSDGFRNIVDCRDGRLAIAPVVLEFLFIRIHIDLLPQLPGAKDFEFFDIFQPGLRRFIDGAGEGNHVSPLIDHDADFLMKEAGR